MCTRTRSGRSQIGLTAATLVVTAETIVKALGGRRAGGGWMARCPAHDDREPSLSLRVADDGKLLIRCHAGCDQAWVIGILRSRNLWPHRTDCLRPGWSGGWHWTQDDKQVAWIGLREADRRSPG